MNEILNLKGTFLQKKNSSSFGKVNIPKHKYVDIDHLLELKKDLKEVLEEWSTISLKINPLISAHYIDVVAKSNRIKSLLSHGSIMPSKFIVGAKFSDEENPKHIITYYICKEDVEESIRTICKAIDLIHDNFGSERITYENIDAINNNKVSCDFSVLKKTKFINTVVDAYYVEKFNIEKATERSEDSMIVSIYDTKIPIDELFRLLGIEDFKKIRSLDQTTALLRPDQYNLLVKNAPYLVCMSVTDISQIDNDSLSLGFKKEMKIPSPTNEPTIGVIDTIISSNTYFKDWVEVIDVTGDDTPSLASECAHGTAVSSIIVDGPALNPELDDGCGRFKVRHFGVSKGGYISSFDVLQKIKNIIKDNLDIKVWNLSLGGVLEINPNFISPESAIIDQLQYEYDVIFIISGTNKSRKVNKYRQKIGAPADSINSLVVNSVDFNDKPASYSREGGVLAFYIKPDVSYYGGDKNQGIWTYSPTGECIKRKGTSFAAPWVARKMAYLINIIGLSREIAKALIIDSATEWEKIGASVKTIGYGIVPKRIEDIIKSKDDEIRFILSGVSEKYDTYNFNIPVPMKNDLYPYIAKATLCYFPNCSRNQGVDYTDTEMDLHFGRLVNGRIKTINENMQGEIFGNTKESQARKNYRKWDNVKQIKETIKKGARPKKVYPNNLWGISLRTKERDLDKPKKNLKFGVVVTLREINGVNRIDEFIHQCSFRGWIVNRIDVENQIDIYNKAEVMIDFDD